MKITNFDRYIIKAACVLIIILLVAILSVYMQKRRETATGEKAAIEESIRLRSENAMLTAMNGAYEEYFNCSEIRYLLGLEENASG